MPSKENLDPLTWVATLEAYLYPFAALIDVDYIAEATVIVSADRPIMAQRIAEFYSRFPGDGFRLQVCFPLGGQHCLWYDSTWRQPAQP
jgi:hypothetical protein